MKNKNQIGEVRTSTKDGSKASYLLMGRGTTELAGNRAAQWTVERQIMTEAGKPSGKVFCSVKVSDEHGVFGYFGGTFKGSIDDASALLGEAVALDIVDAVETFGATEGKREEAKKIAAAKARQIERLSAMIADGKLIGEDVADLEARLQNLQRV